MASSNDPKTAHSLPEKKRTSDVLSSENFNVDFASLMLSEEVQKGLTTAGFETPSPIQLKAIPLGRCGLDLIVQAKSGTGKTCVFSVVALESVLTSSNSLQALILAPTREIAVQIQNVVQAIGGAMDGLRCHTFIGGTIFGQDRQNLKKCHVAVGTPGRIKQLIEYEVLKTDSVRLFILDEADKLLDEKFQASVNWIYHQLPESKQMLALSATYPESLAQQLTNYMRDPTFVRLNPKDLVLQGIKQFYKIVPGHKLPHKAFQIKADHLVALLSQVAFNQCLIFSNLQSRAQNLCDVLLAKGWPATYISGNQQQVDRMRAMEELKQFKCRILISTDLTARGIDAENVNLIVNLDVPADFKTYLHRIGRAGRFGTHGAAFTLASEGPEVTLLRTVQKKSGSDVKLLPDPLPSNLLEMSFGEVKTDMLGPGKAGTNDVSPGSGADGLRTDANDDSSRAAEGNSSSKPKSTDADEVRRPGVADVRENGLFATAGGDGDEKEEKEDVTMAIWPGGSGDGGRCCGNGGGVVSATNDGDGSGKEAQREHVDPEASPPWRKKYPVWSVGINLEDWVVPITLMQQVRKSSRRRWTWEEALKLFEDGAATRQEGGKIEQSVDSRLERGLGEKQLQVEGRDDTSALTRDALKDSFFCKGGDKQPLQNGGTCSVNDASLAVRGNDGMQVAAGSGESVPPGAKTRRDLHRGENAASNDDPVPHLRNRFGDAGGSQNDLKNSDICLEFRALRALMERVRAESAALEKGGGISGSFGQEEFKGCSEGNDLRLNEASLEDFEGKQKVVIKEKSSVNVSERRRLEDLYQSKPHSGNEYESNPPSGNKYQSIHRSVEEEQEQGDAGKIFERLDWKSSDERSLHSARDCITENVKSLARESTFGSNNMTTNEWKHKITSGGDIAAAGDLKHLEGDTGTRYEKSSTLGEMTRKEVFKIDYRKDFGRGAGRRRSRRGTNPVPVWKRGHEDGTERNSPDHHHVGAKGGRTTDKVWEYFKLYIDAHRSSLKRETDLAGGDGREEEKQRQRSRRSSLNRLEAVAQSLQRSNDKDGRTDDRTEGGKGKEHGRCSGIDRETESSDRCTGTGRCTVEDGQNVEGGWFDFSEQSSLMESTLDKIEDPYGSSQLPSAAHGYVNRGGRGNPCYWEESWCRALDGWENYYITSAEPWDTQSGYYGEDIAYPNPYYYYNY